MDVQTGDMPLLKTKNEKFRRPGVHSTHFIALTGTQLYLRHVSPFKQLSRQRKESMCFAERCLLAL